MAERKSPPKSTATKRGQKSVRARAVAPAAVTEKLPADTREALLVSARRVFAAKGFEGATVKDLAEGAGVNVSLVSYHFGGKEGLYRNCLESFGAERAEASERILRSPASREEFVLRLQLFAEDFIEYNLRNADACKVVNRAMESVDGILADVFKKFFVRVYYALHSFVQSAQKNGFLRPELDTDITCALMFGSLMHCLRSHDLAKLMGKPTLDDLGYRTRLIDHWIKNQTQGIFAPPSGADRRDNS
jgi:AcrR family transcriptional regulator